MGVLVDFSAFKKSDIQNCMAMLLLAQTAGKDVHWLIAQLAPHGVDAAPTRKAPARSRDNVTVCAVCGGPAVILELRNTDQDAAATHAIQCQNRPATDKPWRDGMCGHTEYVVRGSR